MRMALGISYKGSAYYGWQQQASDLPTIQSYLQQAVAKVANHPLVITCAGRTDKGVHALGQVGHFDTIALRTERAWLLGINSNLPADIRVHWVQSVSAEFHARFSATARRYRYLIYNSLVNSALLHKQVTWYYKPLNAELMQEAANYLLGEHDFTSYRAIECQARSPIRTLYQLTVTRQGPLIIVEAQANAFLHHMVRNMVGVLLAVGNGQRAPLWAQEVLAARQRTAGGNTAPAAGLYFIEASYPSDFNLPHPQQLSLVDFLAGVT